MKPVQNLWFVPLLLLAAAPVWGQVDLETQRRMIEEFKQEQEAKKANQVDVEVKNEPTKEGDLAVLKQEMADARLEYESNKSNQTRAAVGQATINYVMPLLRLRDYETAVRALENSIKMVGGQDNLSEVLVGVYLDQSDIALANGDYYTANRLIHEAWAEAKASRVEGLPQTVAKRYRDFYWDWAQVLFAKADWVDATSKASEALAWKIDTGPIDALLAEIYYLRDQYPLASDHLKSAIRDLGRSNETLAYLKELLEKESYLERNFRTWETGNLTIRADPNYSLDERDLREAFSKASKEAESTFGI
ncbi:MAG: hypothetical protein KC964_03030, partial [Candidatus Omnitrophica bacterium]|nr:hypothetical protein [Candidatus Omnitrophota bacterium]